MIAARSSEINIKTTQHSAYLNSLLITKRRSEISCGVKLTRLDKLGAIFFISVVFEHKILFFIRQYFRAINCKCEYDDSSFFACVEINYKKLQTVISH